MYIKYELENKLSFEDMCRYIVKSTNRGLTVEDYILSVESDNLYVQLKMDEAYITIDNERVTFNGLDEETALKEFKNIKNINDYVSDIIKCI